MTSPLRQSVLLADELTRVVSARATIAIAAKRGVASGQYVVCGYPKSGTSWVGSLLSSTLRLPVPSFYRVPVLRPAILHTHSLDVGRAPTVFVVRDLRDVLISSYHFRAHRLSLSRSPRFRFQMEQRYKFLPKPFNSANFNENIERFVELELESPRDCRTPWTTHVRRSMELANTQGRTTLITYEELLERPQAVLAAAVALVTQAEPNLDAVRRSVAENAFAAKAASVESDPSAAGYFRSGESGGWRVDLPRTTVELIQNEARGELLTLGYELQ